MILEKCLRNLRSLQKFCTGLKTLEFRLYDMESDALFQEPRVNIEAFREVLEKINEELQRIVFLKGYVSLLSVGLHILRLQKL